MNIKNIFSKAKVTEGWVERRLFDGNKFLSSIEALGVSFTAEEKALPIIDTIFSKALDFGLKKELVQNLLDASAKKQFEDNTLWKFFNKLFKVDWQIPFLFGRWTFDAIRKNTVTTVGKQVAASQFNGVTAAPVTAIAIGVGTGGTTTLNSESTTNGAGRGAATCTNQTTTTTGDTARLVKTFSLTGSFAFTEEGLLDNNSSGGNLACYQTYSAVNVVSGDSFQITHNVKFA